MKLQDIAKCLSCESKIQIIKILLSGETCVNQLSDMIGLKQANTSKHLSELKSKNVILCRIEGQQRCYSINPEVQQKFKAIFDLIV